MFNLFSFDLKKLLLILFVFALPLISINFQRAPGEAPWFVKPFTSAAGGVQGFYASFSSTVRGTTAHYLNLIDIKKKNRELTEEMATLRARLNDLKALELENDRLTKLLDFRTRSPGALKAARVIGSLDLLAQHATIRIDKGQNQGVLRGQAVISPEGVVGTIYNVDPNSSQVLVLTDRYSLIDALVQRTRARGIVEGKSEDGAQLKYLQRTDDVQVGDLVVTTGIDSIFPQGFPVAVIQSVEKKAYGVTQKVLLKPVVDPSRIEEVFVVASGHPPVAMPERTDAPTTTPAEDIQ